MNTPTTLFKSSSEVVQWLRKIASPMIDSEGKQLPMTGFVRVTIPEEIIQTLLQDGADSQVTSDQWIYQMVRDGKRYTFKVRINNHKNKDCVFAWDHRNGNLTAAESEPEPQFQISLRMVSNRVFVKTGTWDEIHSFKDNIHVTAWEIRRWIGGRNVVMAQSTTYHPSVIPWMRNANKKTGESVVDGLLVDVQLERTYIYFTDTAKNFDSCIKIYNGTHLTIVGNVTLENFAGFQKACELAKTYMRPF